MTSGVVMFQFLKIRNLDPFGATVRVSVMDLPPSVYEIRIVREPSALSVAEMMRWLLIVVLSPLEAALVSSVRLPLATCGSEMPLALS